MWGWHYNEGIIAYIKRDFRKNMSTLNTDNMLMSRVYEDLDIDPDMQLTISEFVEIAEDVTDDINT
jgi:hypothetical protein